MNKMIEVMSQHATTRQYERGIKKAYIDLCVGKGERLNVENREGACRKCFKSVFHGLHVVCGVEKPGSAPLVITAYWNAKSCKDVKSMVRVYDELLNERSHTKRAKRHEAKCKRAALKEDVYDEFWAE